MFIYIYIHIWLTNHKFKNLEFCSFVQFCSPMSEKREGRGQMLERRKGRNCKKKCVSKLRLGDLTKCKGYLYQIGRPFEHLQQHFLRHKSNFLGLQWLVM